MTWIYVHVNHRWEDRAAHVPHVFGAGGSYDLPDGVARQLTEQHPSKMCLVEDGQPPEEHVCVLSALEYDTTELEEPLQDTMMRPIRMSAQKRKFAKQAKHRSRRARLEADSA